MVSQTCPDLNARPYSKNNLSDTGDVTQVVERLPGEHKALISNPNTDQKNLN
jgi:hypothetical protein